jgi:hypothetical protein
VEFLGDVLLECDDRDLDWRDLGEAERIGVRRCSTVAVVLASPVAMTRARIASFSATASFASQARTSGGFG